MTFAQLRFTPAEPFANTFARRREWLYWWKTPPLTKTGPSTLRGSVPLLVKLTMSLRVSQRNHFASPFTQGHHRALRNNCFVVEGAGKFSWEIDFVVNDHFEVNVSQLGVA